MTQKNVGYVKLEWTCPDCGTRNPGPQKTCSSCGYPQPEDVQFDQAAGEELITDEAEIEKAKKGPDTHCFYCGARNPAGAKTCSQCGGDLTKGSKRKAGRVVGAHKPALSVAEGTGPARKITCPSCASQVPANSPKCPNCGAKLTKPRRKPRPKARAAPSKPMNKLLVIGVIVAALILMAVCGFFLFKTSDVSGTVAAVGWTRAIAVEDLVPVEHETWRQEIPAGAALGVCTQKVHHTQGNPAPNAKEVCGTPYTVDTGSGYGQVVQDCKYQVYRDWCQFTVNEWQVVDTIKLTGSDFNPRWPANLPLNGQQREGKRSEKYKIIFDVGGERYTYVTHNAHLFNRAKIGSEWILTVNNLGSVTGIEPK